MEIREVPVLPTSTCTFPKPIIGTITEVAAILPKPEVQLQYTENDKAKKFEHSRGKKREKISDNIRSEHNNKIMKLHEQINGSTIRRT